MANTKKTTKKPVKKANNTTAVANRELTNGAFLIILVVGVVIAGIVGWILGTYAYSWFN